MKFRASLLATLAAIGFTWSGGQLFGDTTLYTTFEDFSQPWHGIDAFTILTPSVTSLDNNTTNGVGNTLLPGGAGTNGSLLVNLDTFYEQLYGPLEQSNQAFLSAVDPGAVAGSSLASYSGAIAFDYTKPSPGDFGTFFLPGIFLNYTGTYGLFLSGTTVDNGNGTFTRTVPYTVNALTGLTYFQIGIFDNSDYDSFEPFTIDNIRVVPEPASLALLGLGGLSLFGMAVRRRSI